MENIFKVGSNKEKSVIRVVDTKHLLQYARCQRYIILILTNYEEGAIFFFLHFTAEETKAQKCEAVFFKANHNN